MALTIQITDAGRAALIAAENNGTNAVRIATVGVSATAIAASHATAALPGEIKRIATISGDVVAADTIHVMVRDETMDVFSVRSIALYLADGTLFAAYGQPTVMVEKSAQALMLMALDIRFEDIDATTITFGDANFLNPPATVDIAGVVELATDAEASAGTDSQRAVTPKGLSFTLATKLASWGSDIWRASNDGAGSGLDADLLDGRQASDFALLSGATFSGPVRFGDTNNSIALSGGDPIWFMDAGNDYLFFSRANNYLQVNIGGVQAFRLSASALLRGSSQVWDAGSDGAGSGLDADLLDGKQASEFALLTGAVFSGPVTISSGGDEKLQLRGLNPYLSAYNAAGVARYGYVQFTETGASLAADAGVINFLVAGGLKAQTNIGGFSVTGQLDATGAIRQAGNQVWHIANDGAGSGLDADMLDGRQAADFMPILGANLGGGDFEIISTGQHLRMLNGQELGVVSLGAGGNVDIWAHGDNAGDVVRILVGSGTGTVRAQFSTAGAAVTGALSATGAITQGGSQVWHVGNDGAGSGLDADMLDGKQASAFALLSGANFTGPVSAAGSVTATGATAGIVTLDRASQNSWLIYSSGDVLRIYTNGADRLTLGSGGALNLTGAITRAGSQVWDAGNDGAGSGLDADLLDGRQAVEFALAAAFGNLLSTAGYQGLASANPAQPGLILQWVQGTGASGGFESTQTVNFPISFPNACLHAQVSTRMGTPTTAGDAFWQIVGTPGQSSITVQRQITGSPNDNAFSSPWVLAIGY